MIGIEHLIWGGGYDTRRLYYFINNSYIDNTTCQWYSGDCIGAANNIYMSVKRGIDSSGILCRIGNNVYLPAVSAYPRIVPKTEIGYIAITDKDIGMGIYDYLPECWIIHLSSNKFFHFDYQLYVLDHDELVSKGFQRD